LSELDVAKPDVLQRSQLVGDRGKVLEQRKRLIDGQVEDLGDRLPPVPNVERLPVVSPPLALIAGDLHVGQEVHLD
jgi:hypothetical protein